MGGLKAPWEEKRSGMVLKTSSDARRLSDTREPKSTVCTVQPRPWGLGGSAPDRWIGGDPWKEAPQALIPGLAGFHQPVLLEKAEEFLWNGRHNENQMTSCFQCSVTTLLKKAAEIPFCHFHSHLSSIFAVGGLEYIHHNKRKLGFIIVK